MASSRLPPRQTSTVSQPRLPHSARVSPWSRHRRYIPVSLNFDDSGECWKEKEEVRLRSSYIPIPLLYTRTVHASHILSFSSLLLVVVRLRCFHLAKLVHSYLSISDPRETGSRIIKGKAGTDNIGLLPYQLMGSRRNPGQWTLHQSCVCDKYLGNIK